MALTWGNRRGIGTGAGNHVDAEFLTVLTVAAKCLIYFCLKIIGYRLSELISIKVYLDLHSALLD
jgi:hypothetical protein